MKHPFRSHLVLPRAGFEEVPHDRRGPDPAHALRRVQGTGEREYVMALGRENFDKLQADESRGSGYECSCTSVSWHAASVDRRGDGGHPRSPHDTRTTLVRSSSRDGKMEGP